MIGRRVLRWRDYRTASGARPVKVFIDSLTDDEAAAVVAAMKEVTKRGLDAARHVQGEVYEVRADADRRSFRILFVQETKFILLSLSGFPKKTRKTPSNETSLAQERLRDWRARGRHRS
jgi:phage-related protein